MRDRERDSSNTTPPKPPTPTLPEPTGPEDDRFVDGLTPKAESLLAGERGARSGGEASPTSSSGHAGGVAERRRLTVCGRYRSDEVRVPDLRMSGFWLARAGFDLGQRYEVVVEKGRLTLTAVEGEAGDG